MGYFEEIDRLSKIHRAQLRRESARVQKQLQREAVKRKKEWARRAREFWPLWFDRKAAELGLTPDQVHRMLLDLRNMQNTLQNVMPLPPTRGWVGWGPKDPRSKFPWHLYEPGGSRSTDDPAWFLPALAAFMKKFDPEYFADELVLIRRLED